MLLEANLVFFLGLKQYVFHVFSGGKAGYNGLILSGYERVSILCLCYVT
jgi:hypothetical protein